MTQQECARLLMNTGQLGDRALWPSHIERIVNGLYAPDAKLGFDDRRAVAHFFVGNSCHPEAVYGAFAMFIHKPSDREQFKKYCWALAQNVKPWVRHKTFVNCNIPIKQDFAGQPKLGGDVPLAALQLASYEVYCKEMRNTLGRYPSIKEQKQYFERVAGKKPSELEVLQHQIEMDLVFHKPMTHTPQPREWKIVPPEDPDDTPALYDPDVHGESSTAPPPNNMHNRNFSTARSAPVQYSAPPNTGKTDAMAMAHYAKRFNAR